jgi:hypothetical protein
MGTLLKSIGYLNGQLVKSLSRGATAFAPALRNVPPSTFNGFYIPKQPYGRTALSLTLMNLPSTAFAPGAPYQTLNAGDPLTINPYSGGVV